MSNLPPGCYEADPRAPWNAPDPWEGHKCNECKFFCEFSRANKDLCLYFAMEEYTAQVDEVNGDDDACEAFKD